MKNNQSLTWNRKEKTIRLKLNLCSFMGKLLLTSCERRIQKWTHRTKGSLRKSVGWQGMGYLGIHLTQLPHLFEKQNDLVFRKNKSKKKKKSNWHFQFIRVSGRLNERKSEVGWGWKKDKVLYGSFQLTLSLKNIHSYFIFPFQTIKFTNW